MAEESFKYNQTPSYNNNTKWILKMKNDFFFFKLNNKIITN